jgi:hypothetical protein
MLKILCDKWRIADKRKPALCDAKNASGGLLGGANLPRMLVGRGFQCFCPFLLARLFDHQLAKLVFDSECRRQLELSPKMMRAHWLLLLPTVLTSLTALPQMYVPGRDNS